MNRIFFTLLILVFLPVLPFWLTAGLCLLGTVIWFKYFEAAAIMFLSDLSFGLPGLGWLHNQFSMTIVALVVIIVLEWYKEKLRFYRA